MNNEALDKMLEVAKEYGEILYVDIGTNVALHLAKETEDFTYDDIQFWVSTEKPDKIEIIFDSPKV